MKIKEIELFKVPPRWLFLKVTTDEGIEGWGEPVIEGRADTVKADVYKRQVLDTVWWFKHYTMAWVLTNGGPGQETSLISIDIYKTAFEFFDFGKAAAMSVVVFVVCLAISKPVSYTHLFRPRP